MRKLEIPDSFWVPERKCSVARGLGLSHRGSGKWESVGSLKAGLLRLEGEMYLGSCVLGIVASSPRCLPVSPEIDVHCDVEIPGSDQLINIQLKYMQNLGSKVQYIGCYVKILNMHNYSLRLHKKSL